MELRPNTGHGLLILEVSRSHSDTPQSAGLLWLSDQLVTVTSNWQNTTLTRDKCPCPWWDLNPRYQQVSSRSPHASNHVATGIGLAYSIMVT